MLNQAEAALDAAPLAWTDTGPPGRKVLPVPTRHYTCERRRIGHMAVQLAYYFVVE